MRNGGRVEVRVAVVRRTAAALFVCCLANGAEGWVPRSQIDMSEVGTVAGAVCDLDMPFWLANDRGFVGEVIS